MNGKVKNLFDNPPCFRVNQKMAFLIWVFDIAKHIDDDSFCRHVIQQDINKIALDLRKAHKDDFFSVPEDNPLEDFLQTAEEAASPNSDPEQAAMAFICKRLKLNYGKLSEEEKKWLKRIAQKSDLLKNPNPQRGRK